MEGSRPAWPPWNQVGTRLSRTEVIVVKEKRRAKGMCSGSIAAAGIILDPRCAFLHERDPDSRERAREDVERRLPPPWPKVNPNT